MEKSSSRQHARLSINFKKCLEEIQTIRVDKGLDEVTKSIRELTSLILKHDLWPKIRRDIINYRGGFNGDE